MPSETDVQLAIGVHARGGKRAHVAERGIELEVGGEVGCSERRTPDVELGKDLRSMPGKHAHGVRAVDRTEGKAPRATKLIPYAIGLFVIGVIVCLLGIAKVVPGGIGTGLAFAFWGVLLFAFSFIPLPQTKGDEEPPMSGLQKVLGIFFEPTRVFRNLRAHPHWLAAFLVIAIINAAYASAFVQRLTPERIVDYTMEKMESR